MQDTAGSALIGLSNAALALNDEALEESDGEDAPETCSESAEPTRRAAAAGVQTSGRSEQLKRMRAAALTLSFGMGGLSPGSTQGGEGSRFCDDLDDEDDSGNPASRSKKAKLPDDAVRELKAWLLSPEHIDFPYPTDEVSAGLLCVVGRCARRPV